MKVTEIFLMNTLIAIELKQNEITRIFLLYLVQIEQARKMEPPSDFFHPFSLPFS